MAMLLGVAVAVALSASRAQDRSTRQLAEDLLLTRDVMQLKFRNADYVGWQTGYMLDIQRGVPGATDDDNGQRASFLSSAREFPGELDRVDAHRLAPQEHQRLQVARDVFTKFMALDEEVIAAYRSGDRTRVARANELVATTGTDLFTVVDSNVGDTVKAVQARAERSAASAAASARAARRLMTGAGLIAVLLATGLATLTARSVLRPLARLRHRLAEIVDGDGDLTQRVELDSGDELGELAGLVNRLLTKLREAMRGIGDRAGARHGQRAAVRG